LRLIFVLCLASCATTNASKTAGSPDAVKATVANMLQEQYSAIERLDVDAWHAHHAPDVLWLGDEASGDVHIGRDAVVAALKVPYGQLRQLGAHIKVESKGLQIGVSADGRAAWMADDVLEVVNAGADVRSLPYRHTEVLAEKDGQWWVMAEFWSLPLPNAKAAQMAGDGTMPRLEDIGDGIAPNAKPIAAAIDEFIAHPVAVSKQLASGDDVAFYGNDPEEKVRGGAEVKKFLDAVFSGGGVKQARQGLRAALTPNGQVGFAAYNLVASAEMNNSTLALSYRVMEVFVSEGGNWKVVQLHMAHCVPEDVALSSLNAQPKSPPPAIPDTPAGHTLKAWLEAFNSADEAQVKEYVTKYKHPNPPGAMLAFRKQTGGFDLVSIVKSERLHIEFMVQEKGGTTRALGKLDVKDGDPAEVADVGVRAIPPGLTAADMAIKVDAPTRTRVIDGIVAKLNEFYVFPETATKMAAALHEHQKQGAYDAVVDGDAFAKLLTDHLREISHDRHLRVECVPMVLGKDQPEPDKPPPPDPRMKAELERMNCGWEKAEKLDSNIGYVKFNFFPPVAFCGEKATSMLQSLGDVDAIIFDLRDNGGGDPEMVAWVSSYLFAKRTHLNDLWERKGNKTTEYWTKPEAPGKKYADQPIFVLTSNHTFSGAEEFTYNLKNLKRATIIGETTGGGAHPTGGHPVDAHFMVGVPFARAINPITKTNWEGTGVTPDVKVPADEALEVAKKMAAEKIQKRRRK
jgi:ketosteroid isomerase-like protein